MTRYLLIAPPVLLISGTALYLARAPFGWLHVLTVYLLATLPFSALVAERIAAGFTPGLAAMVGAPAGIAGWLATALLGDRIDDWLNNQQADQILRQVALLSWCLLLQTPWLMLGQWIVARVAMSAPAAAPSWAGILVAALVATALPFAYVSRVIELQSLKAEKLLKSGRLAKASNLYWRLSRVGSRGFVTPEGQEGMYWFEPATDEGRIDRARALAAREEHAAAIEAIRPVAGRNPVAALLCASICMEQEKWHECRQYCRLALALLERLPRNEQSLPLWVQVYDNLAYVAREQKRHDQARALYEEAMVRVAPARAHFHVQLGRLYHAGGRPGKALEHFHKAQEMDPEHAKQVRPLIDEIRLHTPGCLRRWGAQ